jgi:hypothetical protein
VCRERFGLYLTERVVPSGLQCDWVDCIWLRGDVNVLARRSE